MITAKTAKSLFSYCRITGVVSWIADGTPVRCYNHMGYLVLKLNDKVIRIHRLAWLLETGKLPSKHIDHINHDRADNRWANLREADHIINGRNRSLNKDSTSGVCGVYVDKSGKVWTAKIKVFGKRLHCGTFCEKHLAVKARKHAEKIYGFHENHGSR